MTSKERVKKAFEHKEADRVPVGEMHIMSPVSSEILGREAITGEGGRTIKQQMEMVRQGSRDEYVERLKTDTLEVFQKVGLDLITTELDPPHVSGSVFKDVTENGWTTVDEEMGLWARFVYEKDSDIVHEVDSTEKQEGFGAISRHLDLLDKYGCNLDEGCFESTRYVVKKAGDQMFVMAKVPNLIPSGRSWYTLFMEMMYLEPELTKRLCDIYLNIGLAVVKKYIEIGVDCVMIATDWAYNSGPIVSPEMIRKYMIPQVKAIVDLCHNHNVYVLKHTDGNIMKIADDFFNMEIDAYQGIEPNAGMNIAEIKKLYGNKVTLMGNVDCARTLPFGTKEEIIKETKECIKVAAPNGGYIVSSSNTIANPIPASNFLTMVDTVFKYGKYPITI
ncbi:MAG: hypothetical protein A2Y21_11400 [Clostridiales bacterium GWC2_40_7]|nr:MAG: hypothetical protein A2Y21_11400 [Clostridiales bacterium GWC2_40_7]